jgi:hypothetical protein
VARAVVLYFEDNNECDKFLEAFKDGDVVNDQRQYPDDPTENFDMVIPLVVAVPTLFCSCTRGIKNQGWTRGLKWGWWVCTLCHKPSGHPSFMKRLRASLSQGKNLLEDGDKDVAEVTDHGWGVSGRG